MTDPRIPESKQDEARLPDDLDQQPAIGQSPAEAAQHGSEDAQLIAGAGTQADAEPDDAGRTND